MKGETRIIRKLGNQYLNYWNPLILEETQEFIEFIDKKTSAKIKLFKGDYQLER